MKTTQKLKENNSSGRVIAQYDYDHEGNRIMKTVYETTSKIKGYDVIVRTFKDQKTGKSRVSNAWVSRPTNSRSNKK